MKRIIPLISILLALLFILSACVINPSENTGKVPSDATDSDAVGSDAVNSDGEQQASSPVRNIGSQRQVFWDNYIVDTALTDAQLTLCHPVQQEIVYVTDAPWEGNSCDYYSIITVTREDGSVFYRMYYNGWDTNRFSGTADIVICAIESEDGINWTRPDYGLIPFGDDEHTNIVMKTEAGFDNFFVFVDTNPECPADKKYKAVSEYLEPNDYGTLHGYTSPDGLHWTEAGQLKTGDDGKGLGQASYNAFDSVNTCFYNTEDGYYYLYFRGFHNGVRDIRMSKSKSFDFLFMAKTVSLEYTDEYDFALYTNNVQPYYRAPQVIIGFPTRYNDHNVIWTENMEYLPDADERYNRFTSSPRYATTATDAMFMTSRDGSVFDRFTSAWATAGAEHHGNWIYGDCYFAYGMIETATEFEDQAKELSMYAFEGKFFNDPSRVYRYTIRIDGFACYKASSYDVSKVVTNPLVFTGSDMLLNFATSGAGEIVVKILDKDGEQIPGYISYTIYGDQVDRPVTFGTNKLSDLQGQEVRIEFEMRDAEIYSFIIE